MVLFKKKKATIQEVRLTYNNITLDAFIEGVLSSSIDNKIYEEFVFHIRNTEQTYILTLTKKITTLQYKYDILLYIIKWLEAVEKFKKSHPDVIIKQEEEEIWKVLMNIVPARRTDSAETLIARGSRILAEKKTKEMELKDLQSVTEGGQADSSYFSRMISYVAVYHKIQINRKTMLLSEFVEYILIMREQQQHAQHEIQKQKK
jgi:hypothetical protein